MARDYTRGNEYYMQLHELQPPQYYHYDMTHGPSPNVAPPYQQAAGGGAGGGGPLLPAPHPHAESPHHYDLRKKKTTRFGSEDYLMSGSEAPVSAASGAPAARPHAPASTTRKRKGSSYGTGSAYDDDGGEDSRSSRTLPDKKQNHSEIEKRRRDKMNTYISELSSMIPMCGAMARKLDKLTVLRMAVQHLRSVRGALSSCPLTTRLRPAFLSERELNALILQAAHDCFLLVVGCDRGRLLYVSASVKRMLHYEQSELLGQSLFDILHPKDVTKVKEQLSSSDLGPRERLIDAKTMLPVKPDKVAGGSQLSPGSRRSFFCRIKCQQPRGASALKEEDSSNLTKLVRTDKKYCVVQCTGYLKSWSPAEVCEGAAACTEEGDAGSVTCLVAVGRALHDLAPPTAPHTRRLEYTARHTTDGKFLFVDQRVTLALGFLPQELLGTSLYEYVAEPELGAVARAHKAALLRREPRLTPPYCFRRKDGALATIQTQFKPFRNPWTKDVECLMANNTIITESQPAVHQDTAHSTFDMFKQEGDAEMQRLIDSQLESHIIGNTIAEEALRRCSPEPLLDLPADLLHDAVFDQQELTEIFRGHTSLVDNILGTDGSDDSSRVRNNVPLSAAGPPSPAPATPPPAPLAADGNGEAAMAVVMSLLEADAGLGEAVNISGLPWPMP